MRHITICENDCLPRLLGTLCLALSFKKRQQLYDLLISELSQAIVMHRDQPAEKEVLLKRKAEEEALAMEQAEDEAISRQKAEEVWTKVCAQYLARKQSAEATSPKQTSIASPRTTHVDGELLETEISFVESELQALEHALQAWLLLPHCEQVQRCTHARTQRAEDLQSSARFPPSTKTEEDGKKAEEEVLLKGKVEEFNSFCSEQEVEEVLLKRKVETVHSSEHDLLEDSDVPNVEDINDPVKLKELLQEYLQKYKDLSRQVSNDSAGGGVVLGSVDEECAAARKEGDEQEQSSGKFFSDVVKDSFTQSHFPKRFSEIEVMRLSSQDAAERGGSTSSPSTPMTVDTPNTKLGGS
jgi:hypothetical protein